MNSITLLLGIHNHQPVGNFEQVFQLAHDRCYRPFLDILERHPRIRLSLHYTGPLLDWFEKEEPTFLDRLRLFVQRGQVEMLGGGFYEPILSVIPDRDAVGQVQRLSERLRDRLGASPQGLWLAERVWDAGLPKKLAPTGLRYTILDDAHFGPAGFDMDSLTGYYLTEREGHRLAVFPISKDMRYLIPFRLPEELITFLGRLRESGDGKAVTYADDGEKFGMWPGTHQWVFEEGYLERLFTALEQNAEWIRLSTFSEYLQKFPPTGRVYLPSASYEEMMEWALPSEASKALLDRRAELEREGKLTAFRPFLRGGFWDGFFLKYSESNHMHKRMLDVSQRIAKVFTDEEVPEARELLWRAQGNDVYWHGLFGGLYLGNLRHETYRNLIAAEVRLDGAAHTRAGKKGWIDLRVFDMDCDGHDEA
ncbi:MAG: alpha-amylase/4-alpha-glucanotransferase domain-containing protein, partial [Nitrospirota bacterium]